METQWVNTDRWRDHDGQHCRVDTCAAVLPDSGTNVADKFAIAGGTLSLEICVSTLSGIVAAELRDEKAKVSTGQIFLKYCFGLTPKKVSIVP